MELCWLAGDDPVKINAYDKMPVIDYLLILDRRIGENKRLAAAALKNRVNGKQH